MDSHAVVGLPGVKVASAVVSISICRELSVNREKWDDLVSLDSMVWKDCLECRAVEEPSAIQVALLQ